MACSSRMLALLLVLGLSPGVVLASPDAVPKDDPGAPLVIVKADSRYDIRADGTYTQTYHFEFQPTNDAAARREAQQAVAFSPALEDFAVVEAYTRKPDGRIVAVPASGIHDQLPWSTPDLATFSDQRQKVMVFPEVAGGDTLIYTWRRTVRRPVFPGAFMTNIFMGRGAPWHALDLTVTAPASMPLYAEAHDIAEDALREEGGRITRHWHASAPVATDAPASVGPYDRLPRVFVSSFPGYDAFARAYAALAVPKTAPTARVEALAASLTAGVSDHRAQARLLYDWVSRHIRYVAVYLEMGALEPHDADRVLTDGYGDCKDHTVLFHALLAAVGIEAELVMINFGSHYTLSGPPTFAQLNHAISYLPEFDLYADTTAGTAPFGTLPFEEYGKPVVHVLSPDAEGAGGHALRRTPVMPPDLAAMELRTVARLDANGEITGTTTTTASGPFSIDLRRSALWVEAQGLAGAAAIQLRALGTEGAGAFAPPIAGDLDHPFELSGHFRLDARPEILEGDPFAPPVGLRVLVRPGDLLLGPLSQRKLAADVPTPCYAGRQVEELSLELPPDRRLLRLPPDLVLDNEVLSYRSQWRMEGATLMQHRELVSKVREPLCRDATRRMAAAALVAIRRDEQRRLVLAD